jgi:uncharacterized membrane protein YsdA (DUF1294 family)
MEIFLIYLALINILSFVVSFLDKRAAIRRRQRIPEKTLFIYAAIGGSVGLYTSMLLFRHKTRHLSFMLGVPAILILQIIVFWYLVIRQ